MPRRVKPVAVPREQPRLGQQVRGQPGRLPAPRRPGDETILGNPRNHAETNGGYFYRQEGGGKLAWEAYMNHSIHSADRATHLKIVVMALAAGIVVAALGISARTNADYSQTAHIIKAGKPVAVTSSDAMVVR